MHFNLFLAGLKDLLVFWACFLFKKHGRPIHFEIFHADLNQTT